MSYPTSSPSNSPHPAARRPAAPEKLGAEPPEAFRICRIGALHYAIAAPLVRATLFASYGVKGEVPYHGLQFPVLDPRLLFELPPPQSESCQVMLIARQEPIAALLVDDVEERSVNIDKRRFQELPWHFGGRERLWFEGVVAVDDKILVRLHPEGLEVSYRSALAVDNATTSFGSQGASPS